MDKQYRWEHTIGWAIEFTRHDAEITLNLNGRRTQKVIGRFANNEDAEKAAIEYVAQLSREIEGFVQEKTANLKFAKE